MAQLKILINIPRLALALSKKKTIDARKWRTMCIERVISLPLDLSLHVSNGSSFDRIISHKPFDKVGCIAQDKYNNA